MAAQPYPFSQRTAPTSILSQTFDGVPDGMNLAVPAHEILDTQARILVDWLVDQPGITRQRGPVAAAAGIPALPRGASGLFATLNPQGVAKFAALTGDSTHGYFTLLKDDSSGWVDVAAGTNFPAASPYFIVDAKAAVGGGLLIGFSNEYASDSSIQQGIAYWFGGTKANYTGTITATQGSKAITTASGFSANVVPGMFLFANTDDPYTNAYIGCVQSVNSDTSITLMDPSPYTATAKSGTFQSVRGLAPQATVGEITTSTGSTTVTGGNTKFVSQISSIGGTWQLYRASDFHFVGKITAVTNEGSLTLAANAAVSMANEPYVAIRVDADFSISNPSSSQKVGFLNASYANRQFYANKGSSPDANTTVWFSDADALEALDLSTSGNSFEVTSSTSVNEPIRGLAAAYNGLLVFKETETFIVGGKSPDSFDVSKLEDDGVLSGMSVQQYGSGVIWAGREGINFYDGVQSTNLVEGTLGQAWKDTVRTLNPDTYRMWSMVDRDHYFLFLENVVPTFSITKGSVSTTPTRLTFIINMVTRAVTIGTNLDLRGSTIIPATATRHAWYLVNGTDGFGHVCDGDLLFTSTGADAITCIGNSAPGPAIYFESKKFDAGDGMRLKRWKMIAMNYLVSGGNLKVDIILGLNEIGQVATTSFLNSVPTWAEVSANVKTWADMASVYPIWADVTASVFLPARIRMQKKSQFMGFRLYGSTSPLANAQLGPYSVAFKLQRVGRV